MSAEGLTATDADSVLDTIFTGTQYVQLHTGHPGAAGTANVATNTTRAAVTWAAASAGVKATNADAAWTSVPASETYLYASVWSASTNGTFHGSFPVTAGQVLSGQDWKIASGNLSFTGSPIAA